jgi:pimeloyl-ACP methyl ester carboxylesterase
MRRRGCGGRPSCDVDIRLRTSVRPAADAGIASAAYREVIGVACDRMIFLPSDDTARRARLHEAILETPHAVLAQTWAGFLQYDLTAAAARCKLPLLCVNAVMPIDHDRVRQLCPQVVFGQTVGSGHLHQLEVPEQINPMIERFLAIAEVSSPRA